MPLVADATQRGQVEGVIETQEIAKSVRVIWETITLT